MRNQAAWQATRLASADHHLCPQVSNNSKHERRRKPTSPKDSPLTPVHRKQYSRPERYALCKVYAPPEIDRHQSTGEVHTTKIEDRSISNISQAAHVVVLKGFVYRLVKIAIVHFIGPQSW